jgi:hypothetical protein
MFSELQSSPQLVFILHTNKHHRFFTKFHDSGNVLYMQAQSICLTALEMRRKK